MPARGGVASPAIRAWLSYLADLILAEDDHQWQALLLWKTPGAGNGALHRPHRSSSALTIPEATTPHHGDPPARMLPDSSFLRSLVAYPQARPHAGRYGQWQAPARRARGDLVGSLGYFKMLVTRAIASPTVSRATADCSPMNALAGRVSGMVSVGLKAVALVRLR